MTGYFLKIFTSYTSGLIPEKRRKVEAQKQKFKLQA